MNTWELNYFASPQNHGNLKISTASSNEQVIDTSELIDSEGNVYPVINGVADFRGNSVISDKTKTVLDFYEGRSETYDQYLHLTFLTHNENELEVRNGFVDLLNLSPSSSVLEVAAGSGRDSAIIARRLDSHGTLCVQDLSAGMLAKAKNKLEKNDCQISMALADASKLPYKDKVFDAVYSFGGLGEFPDIRAALKEMARVCKIGGKVVVGDESMPVWWRDTEFGRILTITNPQFNADIPFADIPVEAKNVHVRWVIGGVFYIIDFVVGDGQPKGNFDYPIPGPRGGTLRTRYLGQLEAVTPETKELAHKARILKGLSMHDWLEQTVKDAANRDLDSNK